MTANIDLAALYRNWKETLLQLRCILAAAVALPSIAAEPGKPQSGADSSAAAGKEVQEYRDLTYVTIDGWNGKLDVYVPHSSKPRPTVLHIPSGGWGERPNNRGTPVIKERSQLFLDMGFAVVNISYRTSGIASGGQPAFEDCRCALRWIVRNADKYGFDRSRIVTFGSGGGGLLALTTGMATAAAGLDGHCPDSEPLRVAAIINRYGWTNVPEILEGPGRREVAVKWFGTPPNLAEIARRVSPLSHVRADVPPILTIHGDADRAVYYSHATQLDAALSKAGAPHELLTVPNGGHGNFSEADELRVVAAYRSFLIKHGIYKP